MTVHSTTGAVSAGAPVETARVAMILVHGRNAGPANILTVFDRLQRPQVAAIAPAATDGTWYPYSFLSPRERNEPGITSALGVLEALVMDLGLRGIGAERVILLGFSQGACLTAEFALRHPRRYGGVMVLSGGLIGPPGTRWDDAPGTLDGTPVFLGCSDVDAHIPAARVLESDPVFRARGATVTCRLYEGMGHVVNDDEILFVQGAIDALLSA
jgi:phospholipase/carboxylesterase